MNKRLINTILWVIVGIGLLPSLLHYLGIDFGIENLVFDSESAKNFNQDEIQELLHKQFSVNIIHVFLEWTSVGIVLFTVVLAYMHFRITGDISTPIIGTSLFCAGIMDAFHTLVVGGLIQGIKDYNSFVPFTWMLSRFFNVFILICGILFAFMMKKRRFGRRNTPCVIGASLAFGLIGFIIIYISATSDNLPQIIYPEAFISRPFDIGPLLLFVFAGIFIFPRFYKREQTVFALAILLSAIPGVISELHMVFGSIDLLNNHSVIAHILKIFTYIILFSGLMYDYFYTYKRDHQVVTALESTQSIIRDKTLQLENKNQELENFAYIVSHDLQQPIQNISSFIDLFRKEFTGKLVGDAAKYIDYIERASKRIKSLVKGLLDYSRIGKSEEQVKVDCDLLLKEILDDMEIPIHESNAKIICDKLPIVNGYNIELRLLLQNLLSNSLKYKSDNANPVIEIRAEEKDGNHLFSFKDNGIGVEEQYQEKIFIIFQRLHGKSKYEGSGIGLAHCKKIVELHHGIIWVESNGQSGSTFYFTIPIK